MKKLYVAMKQVLFVTDDENNLDSVGAQFLKEDRRWHNLVPDEIKEITVEDEIPKCWLGCFLYGDVDDDTTPEEFIRTRDEEYVKYLQIKTEYEALKEKFEK